MGTSPLLHALADPAERLLARSILGTDDTDLIRKRLDAHCRSVMHTGVIDVHFAEISTGAAFGLKLDDGSRVFLKAWSPATSPDLLRDAHEVQAFLALRGFPCAGVVDGPRPFGSGHAAIHEWRDDGMLADANRPAIRAAMAAALARLMVLTVPLQSLTGLPQIVPRERLWLPPHNALFDFESTRDGAAWIERIAETSRDVLLAVQAPAVIGHRDWSARNMRFRGDEVSVVYDWDSLAVGSEAFFVGKTAASFPMTWYRDDEQFPSLEAAAAFVRDYETAKGRRFDEAERAVIAAAAAYALSYTARCAHALAPLEEPALGDPRWTLRLYADDCFTHLLSKS